jgi:hypothetical protein
LDRAVVRAEAERRFSDTAIAGEYERVYRQLAMVPGRTAEAVS